jgi:hypothetical protein
VSALSVILDELIQLVFFSFRSKVNNHRYWSRCLNALGQLVHPRCSPLREGETRIEHHGVDLIIYQSRAVAW